MDHPSIIEHDADPAQKIHPDLPNHAADEAEFLALVDEGLADIDAGRTAPFEAIAVKLRRKIYGQA